ncbi:polyketide synthase modules-like protein [Oleiphilus messinensis]|uniref:Phenolphthiocerol/phthiocerol polyketide synthase subunit E n=1 Tax=Oleiphilus messinensis TaxID=141451 RepID=A0A1Y0I8B1_9GAMM|nr:type I polyketide synthase [Oleiphilus messinensis]ARU56728.1 polyketide synthase modules-like protein [Oleiphilus messinensis]
MKDNTLPQVPSDAIAIIGMDCRFPGAKNIREFWSNLINQTDSITTFSSEELAKAGVAPEQLNNPAYVPRRGRLDGYDRFDAAFFGYSPREAEMMDPQHRLFLECCWHALEDSGHHGQGDENRIGVFAGIGMPTYILKNIMTHPELTGPDMDYQLLIGNDKDFAPSKVSYKLNLKGPSININTACSTSLVAVHLACQSLLDCQSDMALAGAATIRIPQEEGYLYQDGGIPSPDGVCRAFDADAKGTIGGSGVGVVLLRRLEDALADGDDIYAVIRASALNNDGSDKIGYTAPSETGEAEVIAEAQALADIPAHTIGFIEAHGTATPLGDPIEVAALTRAFRLDTEQNQFCALGSVKTNFGHLDTAAGMAGLIKAALAIKHKTIPATKHFKTPNPKLNLEQSPFFVNTETLPWESIYPLRAGVSSFGVGGTNAHVILEEAPDISRINLTLSPSQTSSSDSSSPSQHALNSDAQLFVLSAKSTESLRDMQLELADYLAGMNEADAPSLKDIAFTLAQGRRVFKYRFHFVASTRAALIEGLRTAAQRQDTIYTIPKAPVRVAFLFPGQGSQTIAMASQYYECFAVFRTALDTCAEILKNYFDPEISQSFAGDIRNLLQLSMLSETMDNQKLEDTLRQTAIAQPVLFSVCYSTAELLKSLGIRPSAFLGHSLGEYVAACQSGVFSLEDGLKIVTSRGAWMQATESGAMLAVGSDASHCLSLLKEHLFESLTVAGINGPLSTTISGHSAQIAEFAQILEEHNIPVKQLRTSGAFHSQLMASVKAPLQDLMSAIPLSAPKLPVMSNLTGACLSPEQACSPEYWVAQMMSTVQFANGLEQLQGHAEIVIESGPGKALTALACTQDWRGKAFSTEGQTANLLEVVGALWRLETTIDWSAFYADRLDTQVIRRVHLPGYPFQRQRFWIDRAQAGQHQNHRPGFGRQENSIPTGDVRSPVKDWFYTPIWKQLAPVPRAQRLDNRWLLLMSPGSLRDDIETSLKQAGALVDCVEVPQIKNLKVQLQGYLEHGKFENTIPDKIIYALPLEGIDSQSSEQYGKRQIPDSTTLTQQLESGYVGFTHLLQAWNHIFPSRHIEIHALTTGTCSPCGLDAILPAQAALLGPIKVAQLEYDQIKCQCIDIEVPRFGNPDTNQTGQSESIKQLCNTIISECTSAFGSESESNGARNFYWVALRQPLLMNKTQRWVRAFDKLHLPDQVITSKAQDYRNTYVIAGGFGGIGLQIAEGLARREQANIILLGRTTPPTEATVGSISSTETQTTEKQTRPAWCPPQNTGDFEQQLLNEYAIKSVDDYENLRQALGALCTSLLANFVHSVAQSSPDSDGFSTRELAVLPRFEKFFEWMHEILEESGHLERDSDRYSWCKPLLSEQAIATQLQKFASDFPGFYPMVEFMNHCTTRYKAALTGEVEAISVLYPKGQPSLLAETVKQTAEHTHHRVYGQLLQHLIKDRLEHHKQHSSGPLRILEVGAGTGILTNWILPAIQDEQIEYHFTDLGRSFVLEAQDKFAHCKNMSFATYDAGIAPEEQGFDEYSFDLVLELDAIHATRDLPVTCKQLKRLLKSNGWLCLLESTRTETWTNMVYGLAEGWWYFKDNLRTDSPLISLQSWQTLLQASGYENVSTFGRDSLDPNNPGNCGLILACQPADAVPADKQVSNTAMPLSSVDNIPDRINLLRALKANVSCIAVDIGNPEQVETALAPVLQALPPVTGIIHCAATENRGPIELKTPEAQSGEFIAKVYGTVNLINAVSRGASRVDSQNQSLKFIALSSSISAISPGSGDSEYCAANSCVDSFAEYLQQQGYPAFTINWERWTSVGMANAFERLHLQKTGALPAGGMTTEEGVDAFFRMVNASADGSPLHHFVMSEHPVEQMIANAQQLRAAGLKSTVEPDTPDDNAEQISTVHYQSDREHQIAIIWQDVLGIKTVSRDDNFHALGGDSLIAIKLVSRIKQNLSTELSVSTLFQNPTIAELVNVLGGSDAQEAHEMDEGVI